MRVFVTGATGFIGSAVVRELLTAGHQVLGLARSNAGANSLLAAGAQVHRGTIEDMDSLRRAAAESDGIIHTAFFHAFSHASLSLRLRVMFGGSPSGIVSRFLGAAVEADRRAIETLGRELKGPDRPLVVAFGTMALTPGRLTTEADPPDARSPGGPRGQTEATMQALALHGVRASIIRLPPVVHDRHKQGLISMMMPIAQKKGVSAYVEDGHNRWAAVHKLDAARLFRLALENGAAGARYHGVAEEGMTMKAIAELIGQRLRLPVVTKSRKEAAAHFGWLANFISADNPVSSAKTQELLGWRPTNCGLISELEEA